MIVSDATKQAYWNPRCKKLLEISIDSNEDDSLSVGVPQECIIGNSMELKETLIPSGGVSVGGCIASTFSIELFGFKDIKKGGYLHAYMNIINPDDPTATYDPIDLFYGKVWEIENNATAMDHIKIKAYDQMYELANTDATDWYKSLHIPNAYRDESGHINPMPTLREVMNSFYKKFNVDVEYDDYYYHLGDDDTMKILPQDGLNICFRNESDTIKALDILKAYCEVNYVSGMFDRQGVLRFKFNKDKAFSTVDSYESTTIHETIPYYKKVSINLMDIKGEKSNHSIAIDDERNFTGFRILKANGDRVDYHKADANGIVYFIDGNFWGDSSKYHSQIQDHNITNVHMARHWKNVFGLPNYSIECEGMPWLELGESFVSVDVPYLDKVAGKDTEAYIRLNNAFLVDRTMKGIQNLTDTFSMQVEVESMVDDYRNASKKLQDLQNALNRKPDVQFVTSTPLDEDFEPNTLYFVRKS